MKDADGKDIDYGDILDREAKADREPSHAELLKWVHEQSRVALFERTHRAACKAALTALSAINHRLAPFK